MKFKKFLESCKSINEAEYNKEWWDSKSDSFKQRYIERHPNSIYAQKANLSNKQKKDITKFVGQAFGKDSKAAKTTKANLDDTKKKEEPKKTPTKDLDKNISDLERQLEALRKQKGDAAEEERKKTWPKIKSAVAPYFNVRSSFAGDEGVDENDPNEWDVAKVKPGVELTPKIIKKVIKDLGGVSKVPDGVLTAIAKNKNTPNDVLEDIYDSSDWDEAVNIAGKRLKKNEEW